MEIGAAIFFTEYSMTPDEAALFQRDRQFERPQPGAVEWERRSNHGF